MKKIIVFNRKTYLILVRFNGFFDNQTSQEMLYHNSVCPLIPFLLQGHNASVFAYGSTGAGNNIFKIPHVADSQMIFDITTKFLQQRHYCRRFVDLNYYID